MENQRLSHFIRRSALVCLMIFALITTIMLVIMALGLPTPGWATALSTVVYFLFALLHSSERLGWKPAAILLILCFSISLLFESLGVATGWIYGPYHYADELGPKFLGLVPYLIPLAWFMMMYPSFLIARRLSPQFQSRFLQVVCLAALAGGVMTAWDLMMDPLMVQIGHWVWEVTGAYFGIPIQNFWGWWLTTFVIFVFFLILCPGQVESTEKDPAANARWDRWAFLSYLVTGLGNGVAAVVYKLEGPALVGLFAMSPWLLLAWWKTTDTIEASKIVSFSE